MIFQMKKLLTCLLVSIALSTQAQTIDKLDQDNGFGNIFLLEEIDSVADFTTIFKDPDIDNDKYEFAMFGSQYTYFGDKKIDFAGTEIKKIFLTTALGYITEIKVVFPHDSSVLRTLKSMYGEPNVPFKLVENQNEKKACWAICMWQGRNVRLIFTAKKYYKEKDSEEAETPDYMYLKITSIKGEKLQKDQ
jgi:hypothetical protein